MTRAILLLAFLLGWTAPAGAETVIAAQTIRAQHVIGPEDLALSPAELPGAFTEMASVVGMEARVVLYAGRPIRASDVGPPALIDRNQVVTIVYDNGSLSITAEGRALGRAGAGDPLRVMNLSSRTTLFGTVQPDGTVRVSR